MNTALIEKKKKTYEKESKRKKPAASEADWERQEKAEPSPRPKIQDTISEIIGDDLFIVDYTDDVWRERPEAHRLIVTRWYPYKKIAVDFPATQEEGEKKQAFFKKTSVAYVPVWPAEASIHPEAFKTRLKEALQQRGKNGKADK